MIYGVGTDIVAIDRLVRSWQRFGPRFERKILHPSEQVPLAKCQTDQAICRFLAKRFSAKEALSKALGTGIRPPVLLTAIAIHHDQLGRPYFQYAAELTDWMTERKINAHLSLSDEHNFVTAFVVAEVCDV